MRTYDGQFIEKDTILNAVYIPETEAILAKDIFFGNTENAWADLHRKHYSTNVILKPDDTMEKNIRWTSSDPDTAEIDEQGNVIMRKTGEVTISALLDGGAANCYVLHIYDSLDQDLLTPQEIITDKEEYIVNKGDFIQIRAGLRPQPNNAYLQYTIEDENIASVDYFGIVEGLNTGTTTVLIEDDGGLGIKKTVRITVR